MLLLSMPRGTERGGGRPPRVAALGQLVPPQRNAGRGCTVAEAIVPRAYETSCRRLRVTPKVKEADIDAESGGSLSSVDSADRLRCPIIAEWASGPPRAASV
jgi:hypothetical protein